MQSIDTIFEAAQKAFKEAADLKQLYEAKVKYLGKSGSLSLVLKDLGKLSPDERKSVGKVVNEKKAALEQLYSDQESQLRQKEVSAKLANERIDVSLPGIPVDVGSQHPIWKVFQEMVGIFAKLGFSVRTGPHIEKDFFNFDALNIPADHSARDLQDTFYLEDGVERKPGEFSPWILRTHTSPVQIRSMITEKPPLRILSPGGVYRSDSDMSHSPHFHQLEGLLVDQNVSMGDLKGTLGFFAREFFGNDVEVRLRPSYFPFVEPGAEFDATCPFCKRKGCGMCKGSGWIELGGCGMVHPEVFKQVKVEYPKWNGYAFGLGVDRMAVVKYGISHIGLLFENDSRFLEQFKA